MTWICHVCGEDRPDECISVHTIKREKGWTENVRYCNDRENCELLAPLGLNALARARENRTIHKDTPSSFWERMKMLGHR